MITAEMLKNAGACNGQVDTFRDHFPNGTEVTIEIAVSVASVFDWDWAADNLLTAGECDKYNETAREAGDTYASEYDSLYGGRSVPWPYSKETQKAIEAIATKYHETRATAWAQGWLNDHAVSVTE